MCLYSLSEPNSETKKSKSSKVIEGALVGYKVADVCFFDHNRPTIRSLFFGHTIKAGWNVNKSIQKKVLVNERGDEKAFSYPNGFHIYTSKKVADLGSHIYEVIPVHFFPKDIVAEGKEGTVCIEGKEVKKSVVVVSKYFLPKEISKKVIDKNKIL